jgi:hypothetical protein
MQWVRTERTDRQPVGALGAFCAFCYDTTPYAHRLATLEKPALHIALPAP